MKSTTVEESCAEGTTTTTTTTTPTTPVVVSADGGADDRAATTIQAVYRGFRARKYVETVTAAAVKIQAGFRGYRVRQSLKNAAPPSSTATATTTTDNSQCWSDDDQKSVVSVTYAPLNEFDRDGVEGSADVMAAVAANDDEVFPYDGDGNVEPSGGDVAAEQQPKQAQQSGAGTADDLRALTDAAVKIQARVRGFAVRKHLNDEKNADKQ